MSDEPATVFGSSSGGIVALTALAHHASVIRTRVALEPPVVKQLADGQKWLDFFSGLYDLYRRSGVEPALQEFREQTFAESDRQVLGRAMDLGDPAQMLANATYWFEHKLRQYPAGELDLDALKARATRIVLTVGRESRGYPACEATMEFAKQLGMDGVQLPGGHLGFVSRPAEFARELSKTLAWQEQGSKA